MTNPEITSSCLENSKLIKRIAKILSLEIRQFIANRHFFIALSVHDFKAQYLGSIFGFVWAVIEPLALIGIYTAVFSFVVAPVTDMNGNQVNFGLFLFSGMLPWLAVQVSLQRGATVFVDLAHIVRHHSIPLNQLPLNIVLSATASQIMAVIAFVLIKLISSGAISYHGIFLFFLIPLQVLFCYGMALILATLNVFVRDIAHLTTTVLFVWFFTSPIIFPLSTLSSSMQKIMWLNPLTCLIEIYRDLMLFERLPSLTAVMVFVGFTVFFLLFALLLFKKAEKTIVDWV
jgi:ABC-type polysaccharide/polyol phosphate export permease